MDGDRRRSRSPSAHTHSAKRTATESLLLASPPADSAFSSFAPPLVLLLPDTLFLVLSLFALAPRRLLELRLVCRLWRDVAQRVFSTRRCEFSLVCRSRATPLRWQALQACSEWARVLRLDYDAYTVDSDGKLSAEALLCFPTLLAAGAWPSLLPVLHSLTTLTHLDVSHCEHLGVEHLAPLTALTRLNVEYCLSLRDEALLTLTGLRHLSLCHCHHITAHSLTRLTLLQQLSAPSCRGIDDGALRSLTALQTLRIEGEPHVTPSALTRLSSLTALYICHWTASSLCALFQLNSDGTAAAAAAAAALHAAPLPLLEYLHIGCELVDADVPDLDVALAMRGVQVERCIYDTEDDEDEDE